MSLELFSTDELITELLNRCDHGAVVIIRDGDPTPDSYFCERKWMCDTRTSSAVDGLNVFTAKAATGGD